MEGKLAFTICRITLCLIPLTCVHVCSNVVGIVMCCLPENVRGSQQTGISNSGRKIERVILKTKHNGGEHEIFKTRNSQCTCRTKQATYYRRHSSPRRLSDFNLIKNRRKTRSEEKENSFLGKFAPEGKLLSARKQLRKTVLSNLSFYSKAKTKRVKLKFAYKQQ